MIRAVYEWIQANTFLDFVIFFVFTYVLEVSKIKVNPWTWIGKRIGRVINREVIEKLSAVEERMDTLEEQQKSDAAENAMARAEDARTRILRAADEIRMGVLHSKEFFNEVLLDVKKYRDYCEAHSEYKNDRANLSIELIEETYKQCMKADSFL